MLEIKKEDILSLASGIVLHSIADLDKYWAFDTEGGDHYELNESAFFLLSQFSEPSAVGTALDVFAKKFNIDNNGAKSDCVPLLADYLASGVFTRR